MPIKIYKNPDELIKVPRFEEKAGFYTTQQRSKIMSKIKGKDSKPELLLRKALWAMNIRFRIHDKSLPGKPDIAIKKFKLAIFIDGEFWHGYNWDEVKYKLKSNQAFWIPKIERNMQKDRINNERLYTMNYTVFRFWSNEIINNLGRVTNQVMLYLETIKKAKIPEITDVDNQKF